MSNPVATILKADIPPQQPSANFQWVSQCSCNCFEIGFEKQTLGIQILVEQKVESSEYQDFLCLNGPTNKASKLSDPQIMATTKWTPNNGNVDLRPN